MARAWMESIENPFLMKCKRGRKYRKPKNHKIDITSPNLLRTRNAADQENAREKYNLGVVYHYGQGVPQNYKRAAALYKLSAEKDFA